MNKELSKQYKSETGFDANCHIDYIEWLEKKLSVLEMDIKLFASDAFNCGRIYQNDNNINPRNFTDWYKDNSHRFFSVPIQVKKGISDECKHE